MYDSVTSNKQRPRVAAAASVGQAQVEEHAQHDGDLRSLYSMPVQRKLSIGAADDPLEREADMIANHVMRLPAQPFIQRKCAKCEEEDKQVQRKPLAQSITPFIQAKSEKPAAASDSLSETIQSTAGRGNAIDKPTLTFMEQAFGVGFGNVNIHTGSKAIQMSRELNAKAFTVGSDIYFNEGQYRPGDTGGKQLLAHELAHVVQQNAVPRMVQRAINVEDFEGGNFTMGVLETYLANFGPGKIEDHNDSDDKARTIVALWRKGKIKLDASKKILLIQEMQSGFTGDDDERAILTLLLNTTDAELQTIFGKGGIDPNDLDSDFQGPEEDVLRAFYDRKCEGGRAAALKGSCKIRDTAAASQQTAPEAQQQPPARVPRKNETDVVILLDSALTPAANTVTANAVTFQPTTPEDLGKKLKALNRPIKTIFYFGHADDSAAIKFGKGWFTADKHAAGLNGMVSPGMEPELVDFRGCRIGMTPPAMEKIRAALGAKAALGGTCWLVTKTVGPFNLGDGDVVSPTRPKRYTDAQLAPGIKMALDSFGPARKCVLDTTIGAYFRAGGKFVSAWFTPVRSITEFDPLYSRCYNSLEPKVVDPAVVAKAQASTSHECQLIKVEEKPK